MFFVLYNVTKSHTVNTMFRYGDSFQARAGLKTRGTNDKDQEDSFEGIPDQKNMLKEMVLLPLNLIIRMTTFPPFPGH